MPHLAAIFACWICHSVGAAHPLAPLHVVQAAMLPEDEPRAVREPAVPGPPAPTPVRRVELPDAVVVGVMDAGRAAFQACVRRAERVDPSVATVKIKLALEIDATGTITSALADVEDPRFRSCLVHVARSLRFPAPGQPAIATLAFFGS